MTVMYRCSLDSRSLRPSWSHSWGSKFILCWVFGNLNKTLIDTALTLLEVVRLPHVHTYESHELQLGQPLSCWRRQGQQVPQVRYLRVDEVAAQLAGSFGWLARVEPATHNSHITDKSSALRNLYRQKQRHHELWKEILWLCFVRSSKELRLMSTEIPLSRAKRHPKHKANNSPQSTRKSQHSEYDVVL
jgi:hypothetical protein